MCVRINTVVLSLADKAFVLWAVQTLNVQLLVGLLFVLWLDIIVSTAERYVVDFT